MLTHLLVPLDGSQLAEAALPVADFLGSRLGAVVTLVHVIEPGAPSTVHGQRHLQEEDQARAYLAEVASRLSPSVCAMQHVHTDGKDNIARAIVAHEGELAPDLIIMCAHGSGGLRDLFFGSVAQQVVASGEVPVLVVRPDPDAGVFKIDHILSPIDGENRHEYGLKWAAELAHALGAALSLLLVLPTAATLSARQRLASRLMPTASDEMLAMMREQAPAYLDKQVDALRAEDIDARALLAEGDPVDIIAEVVASHKPDLVVMGTHGKVGLVSFGEDSVATQVYSRVTVPLLLVPEPPEPE